MTTVSKYSTPSAAGAEVSRRAEAHMSEHQGVSYQEAMAVVLKADKELAKAYGQPAPRARRQTMAVIPAVTPADEAEILEWILRQLKDEHAGALPGDLGKLGMEADRFAKTGMPIAEAAKRAMGLFPHLVAGSKMLIDDIRRNRPEVKPVADGETLAQDKPEPKPPGNPAGFVVHARAEALMQKHSELDYREAIGAVLSEDRELKVRYAGVRQ
jgi:hypothetical protein